MDEISLEQFKSAKHDPLAWNHYDNTIAIKGETSLYLIQLHPDGKLKRRQLNFPDPIKAFAWGPEPSQVTVNGTAKLHMILFVIFQTGKIQAWAECGTSVTNRWQMINETKVKDFECISFSDSHLLFGLANGTLQVVAWNEKEFTEKESFEVPSPITRIVTGPEGIAFSHGIGKISFKPKNDPKIKLLLDDDCPGIIYLQFHGTKLVVIKYNQLLIIDAKGSIEQSELFDTAEILEGFAAAIKDPLGDQIIAMTFDGKLYKLDLESKMLQMVTDTKRAARFFGMTMSSSGHSLILLSIGDEDARNLDILSWESNNTLKEEACGAWESVSLGKTQNTSSGYFSLFKENETDYIRNVISKNFIESTEDDLKNVWKIYQESLSLPEGSNWSLLNRLKPEKCPDCSTASVPFENFSNAKCSSGHTLKRCQLTFKCLGILSSHESCDLCFRIFSPSSEKRCPYCQGRLFYYK